MENGHFVNQFNEIKAIVNGKTMDEARKAVGDGVTNDFIEGERRIIDANYKDILVTITENGGLAKINSTFEKYSPGGIFLGVEIVVE